MGFSHIMEISILFLLSLIYLFIQLLILNITDIFVVCLFIDKRNYA